MRPYDAILLPTVAVPAIALAEVDEASPISGYLTRPGNYLGLCALAMPCDFSSGLPLSLQIVGKPYAERDVLSLGKAYQDATDFHLRAPDLAALGLSSRSGVSDPQAMECTPELRHRQGETIAVTVGSATAGLTGGDGSTR